MIIKFAFRNVLRNKKRSFLTVLTILLAAILVSFMQSWVNGLLGVYIDNFARYMTGHVRITSEEFTKRQKFMPVDELIFSPGEIIEKVKKIDGVRAVRERIRFGILLGNKDTTIQAIGMGIDLRNNEFNLKEKLTNGNISDTGIYLGADLAKKLEVNYGEDLLIATKTSEGGLNGIKLKVNGIFNLKMHFDRKLFFISLKDAKRLLKIYDGTTEIFVFADDVSFTERIDMEIEAILPAGVVSQTHKEQAPAFIETIEAMKPVYSFIETLILFLASFVIINTMMMAIFERLREIGTMKALGMTDRELFLNFTCEGAILGAIGGTIGAVIGFVVIFLVSQNGIDFTSQFENIEMPIEYIIKPKIHISDLIVAIALSIIVPSLAAMIPARYARKLMPADALRK